MKLKNSTMKSDPREIYGLFSRLNGLSRCIFFHSFHSWKKIQLERPFCLSKRPYISLGSDFIVFFFHSLTLITINVRQVHYLFDDFFGLFVDLLGFCFWILFWTDFWIVWTTWSAKNTMKSTNVILKSIILRLSIQLIANWTRLIRIYDL